MQFCRSDWDKLRGYITKYELDHLVAPNGRAAAEMMKRQIDGTNGPLDYDPLMAAHNTLMSIAMDYIGLGVMVGDKCPVCELRQFDWLDGAAQQSRLYAEKKGLLLTKP